MPPTFKKATKAQAKLRMALVGAAGSGKTYSGLNVAQYLGDRIAVIDTERGSASKYAGDPFEFDTLELESFHPDRYIEAIKAADDAGYEVLIIDSLSHAWSGKDGALELKDRATAADTNRDSFGAWRKITPLHNQLVDAILACRMHVIVTMRTKTEYVVEKDDRGKSKVRKVGLAPIQRDGVEYEFDVVGDMDTDNTLVISKTRCATLSGMIVPKPGEWLGTTLKAWLDDGIPQRDTSTIDTLAQTAFDLQGEVYALDTTFVGKTLDKLRTFDEHKLTTYRAGLTTRLAELQPQPTPQTKPDDTAELFPPEQPHEMSKTESAFWDRYGEVIGTTWTSVQKFLGGLVAVPTTDAEWTELDKAVNAKLNREAAQAGA